MTVAELAAKINVSTEKLFEFFEYIQRPIPREFEFELSEELIKIAEENKISSEKKNSEEVVQEVENNQLKKLLAQSSQDMIKRIKEANNLVSLVLSGRLKKSIINGKSGAFELGFFEDIVDLDGNDVYYPKYSENQEKINNVYIANPDELQDRERYYFKCELASNKERQKQENPYLLQTTIKNVQSASGVNDIVIAIKQKQTELEKIDEKAKSANEKIEEYNQKIINTFNEIQNKEDELSSLKESFDITKHNLLKMENLINTLKERITLCKNLQFVNKDDESKYLNLLSAKEFKPANHLDFELDFEKSFSKLADHIHAYLYHKKSLIYTNYQIRNFLTLLKTHDIIVLSGLSGSGKTQIVKAFAEALGGVAKIIPVKPNWTSSDDLTGYYNPLQMSFLPTPFTEAIVEAIHNPNQLYFICLDEMNLARVEYYFADFLFGWEIF